MSDKILENLETFQASLEQTGSINIAATTIGLCERTIRNFRRQNQEFDDLVKDALEVFELSHSQEWGNLALKFTTNLLKSKVTKKTVTRRFFAPKKDEDDSGGVLDGELIEVYREEREEEILPPKWLVERFLPSPTEKQIQVNVNFAPPESVDPSHDPEAKQLED